MDVVSMFIMFLCAFILGTGIGIGGMLDPTAALRLFASPVLIMKNYISINDIDFTLFIVFASGLFTNFIIYHIMLRILKKPLLGKNFSIPTNTIIDSNLVLGSAIFGFGWALGGFCPGPAVASLVNGHYSSLLFTLFMFAGMATMKRVKTRKPPTSNVTFVILMITVISLVLYLTHDMSYNTQTHNTFEPLFQNLSQLQHQIIGGCMIGLAISLLMILQGKILGISGILSGLFDSTSSDKVVRFSFFMGLIASGEMLYYIYPYSISHILIRPTWCFAFGGLLVGIGTSMANGCTSGHGICGNTRLSKRSFIATCMFMMFNFIITSLIIGYYN